MTKTALHIPTVRSSYCTYAQTYKHYPLTAISTRGQDDDELSNTLYIKAGHLEMKKKSDTQRRQRLNGSRRPFACRPKVVKFSFRRVLGHVYRRIEGTRSYPSAVNRTADDSNIQI